MAHRTIFVRAQWDDEAKVWVASSTDIDGLSIESETLEALSPKVAAALADLIELNGLEYDTAEIPVHILAEQLTRIPNPTAA